MSQNFVSQLHASAYPKGCKGSSLPIPPQHTLLAGIALVVPPQTHANTHVNVHVACIHTHTRGSLSKNASGPVGNAPRASLVQDIQLRLSQRVSAGCGTSVVPAPTGGKLLRDCSGIFVVPAPRGGELPRDCPALRGATGVSLSQHGTLWQARGGPQCLETFRARVDPGSASEEASGSARDSGRGITGGGSG